MKTVAIIQARMSSTRLAGKVLADVGGKPILWYVVNRAGAASRLDEVIVATSQLPADDAVENFCDEQSVKCFRGSHNDVLDRYYNASRDFQADVVVRLTADCPLLDPGVIDRVVFAFEEGEFDYVSNFGYPDGLDTEVFRRNALARAWREARLPSEREHVTPYICNHPELFRLGRVHHSQDLSSLRWTVDEPEDLMFLRAVYDSLGTLPAGMAELIQLLKEHPELVEINKGFEPNEGYKKSLLEDEQFKIRGGDMSGTGQRLYAKARKLIPGGTQLLSKRPELFLPDQWPSYYSKARGVEVWDLDGNKYIDMSHNGIGACVLGAADPDVDGAVKAAIDAGSMSTLNCPEEVELAQLLCELHPWAEMVRFGRSGGEAMAVAVRIARARTRRDKVAFCGYHGWHDWYLAANLAEDSALDGHLLAGLEPAGVPRGLMGTAVPFRYNRIDELEAIVSMHRHELAAVVMEPIRDHDPDPDFLESVKAIATDIGAVLIFDEITAGWRLTTGGAHLHYQVNPEIAVFAKAMSNGYPMAAIIGTSDVMQAAQNTFISSTYWTERVGPTAALATIRKHQRYEVAKHLMRIGELMQTGWKAAAAGVGIPIHVGGILPLSHFSFEIDGAQAAQTLFTQLMLERGYLADNSFYATFAHTDRHVEEYFGVVEDVFLSIAQTVDAGMVSEMLKGPVAHTGFQRLT